MPQYPVNSPLRHDGKPYAVGDTVTMAEKSAANLVLAGVLGEALPDEPVAPSEDPKAKNGGKKSGAAGKEPPENVAEQPPKTQDSPAPDAATEEAAPPAPVPEATK